MKLGRMSILARRAATSASTPDARACRGSRIAASGCATTCPSPNRRPARRGSASRVAGLCHTDLELVRGYYPYAGVLGHEFVGVVDRAPSDARVGRPPRRRRDQRDLRRVRDLPRRTVEPLRAAHRPRHRRPRRRLRRLPDAADREPARRAGRRARRRRRVHRAGGRRVPDPGAGARSMPRDRVVVFGDGKLGQVIAQVLATTGCALTVVGRHPRKLAHLAARGIATQVDAAGGRGAPTSSSTAPAAARACRRRSPRCARAARSSSRARSPATPR